MRPHNDNNKRKQRKIHHAKGQDPAQETPVRISLFDDPNRKQQRQNECQAHPNCRIVSTANVGGRPALPAKIKEEPSQERHGPTVIILRIERPLHLEVPEQPKPEQDGNQPR